jgi:guanine deaminase
MAQGSSTTTMMHGPNDVPIQWVFRGNIVVPTRNPFRDNDDPSHCNLDDDEADSILWLGPGLAIYLDHVLTVDDQGIIQSIGHAKSCTGDIRQLLLVNTSSDSSSSSLSRRPRVIQLSEHEFLCPGFIDLHVHAPQYAFAGTATDRPLLQWLGKYTFPTERRFREDLKYAHIVYNAVVSELLIHGTTTAVYFATLDVEPCRILVDAAFERGQRALIGKVCMDRNAPADYCHSTEQNIRDTETFIEYIYQTAGRRTPTGSLPLILPVITPRFIPTCSPQLLRALGDLARVHSCHVTSHISESVDEVEWSRQLDQVDQNEAEGRSDAVIFDSCGLLTNQCVMAHGVHLEDDSDWALLRSRGTSIAHCPLSNFFFAGNVLPTRQLMQRGNRVGLGTDIAGGSNPSMLHSARMAVVASRALQHQYSQMDDVLLDYRHAFYLATLGGAESLGLQNRIGTLRVGMEFDAVVLSAANQDGRSPVHVFETDDIGDVFQKLCVLGDDRNIRRVFVQGKDVTVQRAR